MTYRLDWHARHGRRAAHRRRPVLHEQRQPLRGEGADHARRLGRVRCRQRQVAAARPQPDRRVLRGVGRLQRRPRSTSARRAVSMSPTASSGDDADGAGLAHDRVRPRTRFVARSQHENECCRALQAGLALAFLRRPAGGAVHVHPVRERPRLSLQRRDQRSRSGREAFRCAIAQTRFRSAGSPRRPSPTIPAERSRGSTRRARPSRSVEVFVTPATGKPVRVFVDPGRGTVLGSHDYYYDHHRHRRPGARLAADGRIRRRHRRTRGMLGLHPRGHGPLPVVAARPDRLLARARAAVELGGPGLLAVAAWRDRRLDGRYSPCF